MILITDTFATPEENLAFDEAMIEVAEAYTDGEAGSLRSCEVLRVWEMAYPCVILGRASKRTVEVNVNACEQDQVPVLRRVSGGATIVGGPGCLMYSVLIDYKRRPSWRMLDVAHREVMIRIRDATQASLAEHGLPGKIELKWTCDLTLNDRKFSGNALRCKRDWMLYHGTIMISIPTEWLSRYLEEPPRQPEYRQHRTHETFVTRLLTNSQLSNADNIKSSIAANLARIWETQENHETVTVSDLRSQWQVETKRLMQDRYLNLDWHHSL